ncbi:MAG TPA: PQQ-binding-like beta-propeller repeat protein, partial [Vicinamibacteria bacterium]|nr:PQQ-binding-like beta-propeller repeat protein [Vicinamibacteria bacterium]
GRRGARGSAARNPIKWQVETGTLAYWDSRPIVAADGTVFAVGAPKGENPGGRYPPGTDIRQMSLLVFDADGHLKDKVGGTIAVWGQLPHMWIRQNDAMTAYAVDSSGGVYHFSGAGGGEFRALGTPVAGPPAVDSGGRLYVGGTGIKGLDIGGADLLGYHWEVGTSWIAPPALDDSGTLFAATTFGGRMYALRTTGETLWVSRHDVATPVLDGKGRMYLGKDDRLSAIATSNGEMLWQQTLTGPIVRDPLIAPDGSIVVVSNAGLVQSYDESGHRRWSFALPNRSSSNPHADASGTLFISDESGIVHAIDRTGKERWTATVPGAAGTPATGPDGTVYVECANGTFYALRGPS